MLVKRLLEFPEEVRSRGRAAGAAPDLRLLDRGRRRLPRLLPRLPGGRSRGRGGREPRAWRSAWRRSGRSPPRWGCWESRLPSGCDAARPLQAAAPGGDLGAGRRGRLVAAASGLRRPGRGPVAARRAARAGDRGGGGGAGRRGDLRSPRPRRLPAAARSWSTATSPARGWPVSVGLAPAPGLHEYLRWEAEPRDVLQPVVLAGPARRRARNSSASAPAGRRRRPRPCSACRASPTWSPSCAAPTSWCCCWRRRRSPNRAACLAVAAQADAAVAGDRRSRGERPRRPRPADRC